MKASFRFPEMSFVPEVIVLKNSVKRLMNYCKAHFYDPGMHAVELISPGDYLCITSNKTSGPQAVGLESLLVLESGVKMLSV